MVHSRLRKPICLLLCLVLLSLTGCSKTQPSASDLPVDQPDTQTETEPTTQPELESEPEPVYCDPLTGLPCSETQTFANPVSVMINNYHKALPQSGIGSAGIIYECLTEGSITRLMAIFNNYQDLAAIGPVRSARHYYIDISQGYSPYYIHYGGSPQAYASIKTNQIQDLDGLSGLDSIMFYRDQERLKQGMSMYEHSAFTTGAGVLAGLTYKGYAETSTTAIDPVFSFAEEAATPEGDHASVVTVPFSTYCSPTFTYDNSSKQYLREEFDAPQIDELTGEQLRFTNLFVISVPQKAIAGDTAGRIDVTIIGSFSGYYFSQGRCCKIHYEKTDRNATPVFTLEDGTPLAVNPGNSYIAMLSNQKSVAYQ